MFKLTSIFFQEYEPKIAEVLKTLEGNNDNENKIHKDMYEITTWVGALGYNVEFEVHIVPEDLTKTTTTVWQTYGITLYTFNI